VQNHNSYGYVANVESYVALLQTAVYPSELRLSFGGLEGCSGVAWDDTYYAVRHVAHVFEFCLSCSQSEGSRRLWKDSGLIPFVCHSGRATELVFTSTYYGTVAEPGGPLQRK
jgi:hypothetical protein